MELRRIYTYQSCLYPSPSNLHQQTMGSGPILPLKVIVTIKPLTGTVTVTLHVNGP